MLLGIVNQFAAAEHRPVAVASKGGGPRAYAKHDQEDAQDFLSHLLNNAHLVHLLPLWSFLTLSWSFQSSVVITSD